MCKRGARFDLEVYLKTCSKVQLHRCRIWESMCYYLLPVVRRWMFVWNRRRELRGYWRWKR